MKYFTFDPPTPRRSHFRLRGDSSDFISETDWGRPMEALPDSLDVRIMFRDGTKSPLGDFPDLEDGGLVASESALEVFREDVTEFFEVIPLKVTGAGVIKKSGIWYKVSLEEMPDITGTGNDYFYLHPARSLQREFGGPAECAPFEFRDLSGVEIDEVELKAKIERAKAEYLGPLGELQADIGSYDVGSIIVAGNLAGGFKNHVGIYFAEQFINTCKKKKLSMMRLREVTNNGNV